MQKEKLEAVKVKRARAKKAKAHSIAKRQAAKEAKLAAAQQGEQGTTNTKPQNDTTSKPNLSESPSTTKQKSKADGKTKGKKKANRHEQADSTQVAESTPVSVPTPEKPPKKKQKVGGGRNVIPPSNAPSTTPALEAANTLPPSRPDKPIRTKPSKDSVLSAKMTKTVKAHSSSKSTTRKLHKALASDKSRSLGSSRTKKSLAS